MAERDFGNGILLSKVSFNARRARPTRLFTVPMGVFENTAVVAGPPGPPGAQGEQGNRGRTGGDTIIVRP
ncbi:MAG: hypothetical protein EXR00_00010 [Alphaproteobacteria bacterium]|nr:hypothetical protein [Alphaproteobacteria bacterium]